MEKRVLATLEYSHEPNSSGHPSWCRLRPEYIEEVESWVPLRNATEQFPSEGLVFWPQPGVVTEAGSAWIVTVREQSNGKKDDFRVTEGESCSHFAQLRGDVDVTDLRRLCASGAFTFTHLPIGPLLVETPGDPDHWIGPMRPSFHLNESTRWQGAHALASGFLPVRKIGSASLQDVVLAGSEVKVLRPGESIGGPVDLFNAQEDENLLQSAAKVIRRFDSDLADAIGISKAQVREYVELISGAGLVGEDVRREAARSKAILALEKRVDARFSDQLELVTALLERPELKGQVDHAIESKVESLKPQLEARARERLVELDGQIAAKEQRIKQLESETSVLSDAITKSSAELATLQESNHRQATESREELDRMVTETLNEGVASIGRHWLLDTVSRMGSRPSPTHEITLAPPSGKPLSSMKEIRGALAVACSVHGISLKPAIAAIAGVLSGRGVLLAGRNAANLADVLARVLAGGNAFATSITTDVFGPGDVLRQPVARIDPCSQASEGTLGVLLAGAPSSGGLISVVLAGVNRAPTETFLAELGAVGRSIAWSRTRGDERVGSVCRTEATVLLGTLVGGQATFPIPSATASTWLLIDADRLPIESPISALTELPQCHIARDAWVRLRNEANAQAARFEGLPTLLGVKPSDLRAELACFYLIIGDDPESGSEWIRARILSLNPAKAKELASHLDVPDPTDETNSLLSQWAENPDGSHS